MSIKKLFCSIRKLVRMWNPQDSMVKLSDAKIKWSIKQVISGKLSTKDVAEIYDVSRRRIQELIKEYKEKGIYPIMKKERRPKTDLSEEDKKLIDKALGESLLEGAVKLKLFIEMKYNKALPYNKIHNYLLKKGVSNEDEKKKRQRKYCRYQRDHSFSLVHLDWHESKFLIRKQVCIVEDDASRLIICGGEFDNSKEENNIKLIEEAIKIAYKKYSSIIREVNTDKGSQFYSNKFNNNEIKGLSEFEKFLIKRGINHIPSRRNHPQTNGKEKRWFRTYEENRYKFKTFQDYINWYNDMVHLGLNRKKGVTPNYLSFL